jgi:hypothetical protein
MIKNWIKSLVKKIKALWFHYRNKGKYIEDTHIYED